MSTLPLYLNEQKVTIDELAGTNYLVGLPELAQLMLLHNADPTVGFTNTRSLPFIYPLPGKQSVYVSRGRSWAPGQRLRAYKSGVAASWLTLLINAYDKLTGKLTFEIVAASYFDLTQPTFYLFTPYFPEYKNTSLLPLANGGTAANNVDDARTNLQFPTHSAYSTQFADFTMPNVFARRIQTLAGVATDVGIALEASNVAVSGQEPDNHPGILKLSSQQVGGTVGNIDAVCFGKPFLHDWTDFSGTGTVFEADVYIPTLSNSTNRYTLDIGLIGVNAKIIASYNDNVNTARFTYSAGIGASYTVQNTTLTVAAATWYRVRIEVSGANIQLTINGAQALTYTAATFAGLGANNRMTPMIRITDNVGIGGGVYVDYMYFRKNISPVR